MDLKLEFKATKKVSSEVTDHLSGRVVLWLTSMQETLLANREAAPVSIKPKVQI